MKAFVAMLTAVGTIVAGYLIYEMDSLKGEIERLDGTVNAAASAAEELKAAEKTRDDSPRWQELASRLAQLEEERSSAPSEDGSVSEIDVAEIQARLAAHDEELAAIVKDLEGARRTRGALDGAADRLLGAVGEEAGSGNEGQRGGMERLMEMGALFRKRPEELTEEERARRDEMTSQLRKRQSEWAVRGFDRTLEVKLTDQQRAGIQQILEEERTALDETRGQDLTDEERSAARKQVRAQSDQRAAGVLSVEQYESWTSYRSRSSRSRIFGGFGRRE